MLVLVAAVSITVMGVGWGVVGVITAILVMMISINMPNYRCLFTPSTAPLLHTMPHTFLLLFHENLFFVLLSQHHYVILSNLGLTES